MSESNVGAGSSDAIDYTAGINAVNTNLANIRTELNGAKIALE